MPDIRLFIVIAAFFNVSIPEIIDGKKECKIMGEEENEVVEKLTAYAETE